MLHITSYQYYPLAEIHLYQGYFKNVMSLIYEHVLSNKASCGHANTVQEIINKGTNVDAKGENGKVHITFDM
jgi:hypothetical protein